jgi:hypothetical protein
MVTIPPCITWNYRTTKLTKSGPSSSTSTNASNSSSSEATATETFMEITLLPAEVILSPTVITSELSALVHLISVIKDHCSSSSSAQSQSKVIPGSRQIYKCNIPSLSCYYQLPMDTDMSSLLSRGYCTASTSTGNYSYYPPERGTASIGLELKTFFLDFQDKCLLRPSSNNNNNTNHAHLKEFCITFDQLSIFAQGSGNHDTPKRMDFVKCLGGSGHDNSSPSTTMEIRYKCTNSDSDHNKQDTHVHHFPYSHPISLAKAPQESTSRINQKSSWYYAAVADKMLKKAKQCNDIVQVSIPLLIVDVTVNERNCLLKILSDIVVPKSSSSSGKSLTALVAVNVTCHRSILWLHNDNASSLLLVLDSFKFHTVKSPQCGIMQCRMLTHDFTLFEGNKLCCGELLFRFKKLNLRGKQHSHPLLCCVASLL